VINKKTTRIDRFLANLGATAGRTTMTVNNPTAAKQEGDQEDRQQGYTQFGLPVPRRTRAVKGTRAAPGKQMTETLPSVSRPSSVPDVCAQGDLGLPSRVMTID
jgi:hypothetical protein